MWKANFPHLLEIESLQISDRYKNMIAERKTKGKNHFRKCIAGEHFRWAYRNHPTISEITKHRKNCVYRKSARTLTLDWGRSSINGRNGKKSGSCYGFYESRFIVEINQSNQRAMWEVHLYFCICNAYIDLMKLHGLLYRDINVFWHINNHFGLNYAQNRTRTFNTARSLIKLMPIAF